MSQIPNQVMQFAGGENNLAVYNAFKDYFRHYQANNGKEPFISFSRIANKRGI